MLLARFTLCSLLLLAALASASAFAADDPNTSAAKEQELLAVLRSEAPDADKALVCKQLAIHGTSAAVSDLAKLLPNEQFSSWARIALEAIPGPEADAALRTAAETLEGRLLIGMINSIGVRRDADSVEVLAKRLQDKDTEVVIAAAVALGRIANAPAIESLTKALASAPADARSGIAEGCVLAAERLLADGQSAESLAIYDQVRKADVPMQRVVEATRGAILARGQDGLTLLLEQLQSPEKALLNVALMTAREIPGDGVDKALANALTTATPERAALIIQAMADRPQTVFLIAVLHAAQEGPAVVRLSALDALGRVGNEKCLAVLLQIAVEPDAVLSQAAKGTLANLPGDNVNSQIVALLPDSQGATYLSLLQLIGQRRIAAVPQLQKALTHADPAVRSAALSSLGETVDLKNLSVLISQVIAPQHPEDAPVAEKALKAASIRMPDREACAAELAAAIEQSKTVATKGVLLDILGAMGGPKALATLAAAAGSKDTQLQDISSRLLGEWMTEDAAPVLLDLAKAPGNQYQIRALRGYIRIARQFVLPEPQRAEMCQKAFQAARQPAEKKLVLEVLKRYPSVETLKQAVSATQVADVKDEATQTVLAIAQKVKGHADEVKALLAQAGLDKVKLEIVKAEYGSGATQKDVTEILQKQVGELPLLTLPAESYNTSFGGDPLPGSVKLLKVQYKLNDKAGEVSFAEDALLVFPIPK